MERADLYLKVYRRKDGVGVTPHAQENIVSIIRINFQCILCLYILWCVICYFFMWENVQCRIEGLLSEEGVRLRGEPGSTSGILWSKDDAYAWVFGPKRLGRVCRVGFGITLSGRSVTNASKFTSTPSSSSRTTQRFLELENNNALIREQLAQVQDQIAQSEARH